MIPGVKIFLDYSTSGGNRNPEVRFSCFTDVAPQVRVISIHGRVGTCVSFINNNNNKREVYFLVIRETSGTQ